MPDSVTPVFPVVDAIIDLVTTYISVTLGPKRQEMVVWGVAHAGPVPNWAVWLP